MNYLKLSVIFISVFLVSCSKDGGPMDFFQVVSDTQISVIRLNDADFERFYYDDDGRLVEVQTDYTVIDTLTLESETLISSRFFVYNESGKLDYVLRGSVDTVDIRYEEGDIFIEGFHSQFEEAFLQFRDYLSDDKVVGTMYLDQSAWCMFTAEYDVNLNYLNSTSNAGQILEDECPGFYYLSQYYGEYSYDNNRHPYSSLPVEVQYFLYQKPFVNSVTSIQRNNKRIEYTYDYNSDGYPVTSKAITIYPSGPDTLFHGTKEYIYH